MTISAPMLSPLNVAPALAFGYLAFSLLYLGSAALHLGHPVVLRPAAIDAAIPFLDWTLWVYVTQFLLLPAAVVLGRDDADRSRAFYSMLVATVVAAGVFVAWPTEVERQAPPADGLTGLAWSALYFMDTPRNCFPSLHVALAAIAGTALWRRGWRVPAVAWPAAIAVSTLTTKQHVAWDVAGGLALAVLAWTLTPRLIRHERP